jgi:hypothetical protein
LPNSADCGKMEHSNAPDYRKLLFFISMRKRGLLRAPPILSLVGKYGARPSFVDDFDVSLIRIDSTGNTEAVL